MADEPIQGYRRWLREQYDYEDGVSDHDYFDSVVNRLEAVVREPGGLWDQVSAVALDAHDSYQGLTRYPLLVGPLRPPGTKSYESFFSKTFRRNRLENVSWPAEPPDGWIEPSNWFETIHDLVRTTIVVKYLDGVKFLADRLASWSTTTTFNCDWRLEARTEGYYAAHLKFSFPVTIPQRRLGSKQIGASLEVQITTQLQEVLRTHLHGRYESNRMEPTVDPLAWQWDYSHPEFSINYLGHVLHYLEGKILEVREKERSR
ncbi:MAG: hypothetical protein U0667_08560 [Chloroflexota bacterium]